jgi:predicted ArsR family transcriptional regulator
MSEERTIEPIEAVGLLAEPVRRALYEFVARSHTPVDRDQAALGVNVGRPLAAFHLDRLAAAGLLEVEYRRRSGRSGPGAGRPAKFYRRAGDGLDVSVPPRRYGLAARVFAEALERIPNLAGVDAVSEAAAEEGTRIGRAARSAEETAARTPGAETVDRLLRDLGFEPETDAEGTTRLRNCPFNDLVADHREVSCGANLAMLGAVLASIPEAELSAHREDTPGYCCVAIVPPISGA